MAPRICVKDPIAADEEGGSKCGPVRLYELVPAYRPQNDLQKGADDLDLFVELCIPEGPVSLSAANSSEVIGFMRPEPRRQEPVVDVHGEREGDADGVENKVDAQVIVAVDFAREAEDDAEGDHLDTMDVKCIRDREHAAQRETHLGHDGTCFGEQGAALTTPEAMDA